MRSLTFAAIAFVSAAGLSAQQAPAEPKKSEPAVFTGCVGEGVDKGTYYVADLRRASLDKATIGLEPNAIFALDSPRKLKDFVGKVVEIHGTVENVKKQGN